MKTLWLIPLVLLSSCQPAGQKAAVADSAGTGDTMPAAAAPAFDRTLELQGITFHITSTTTGSLNRLTIAPSGLEIVNTPIVQEIDGLVTAAEVSDIDANGSPEVWVFVTSTGSGSYGSVVAYSANRRKSLSEIYLPPVTGNPEASQGYMGHDEFQIAGNRLVQRFPVYKEGDSNAAPTGGMRRLEYRLVPGEAVWTLVLQKMTSTP